MAPAISSLTVTSGRPTTRRPQGQVPAEVDLVLHRATAIVTAVEASIAVSLELHPHHQTTQLLSMMNRVTKNLAQLGLCILLAAVVPLEGRLELARQAGPAVDLYAHLAQTLLRVYKNLAAISGFL